MTSVLEESDHIMYLFIENAKYAKGVPLTRKTC